jgi:prepilin peptidase CpaA
VRAFFCRSVTVLADSKAMYPHWLLYIPLLAALVYAAIQDALTRRIRNYLTFTLMLTGLAQSFFPAHTVTPAMAFAGFGAGFALTFLLFAMGALGGGDVKLLSGVGAWLGPVAVLQVFLVAAIVGLIIVLVQSMKQKRLLTLFRNSAMLTINIVHASDVGIDHVSATGKSCRSVDKPLPYAVPVLVATVLVLVYSGMGL